jgi:hypothetical protein
MAERAAREERVVATDVDEAALEWAGRVEQRGVAGEDPIEHA